MTNMIRNINYPPSTIGNYTARRPYNYVPGYAQNKPPVNAGYLSFRKKLEMNPDIAITDRDPENDLDLFCYKFCDNKSSSEVKDCRGIVFNRGRIILRTFPYTTDFSADNEEEVNKIPLSAKFFMSYEGSLIRIFYFKNKWYVSTHRKLNAFKTKWSYKQTFGDIFYQALYEEFKKNMEFLPNLERDETKENVFNAFFDALDKDKAHMFLIRSMGENRLVCREPDLPTLYFVGSFLKKTLGWENPLNITTPEELTFSTHSDLIEKVKSLDFLDTQGVIAFCSDNKQIKVMHPTYFRRFELRGNQPSIKFRYLEIRKNEKSIEEYTEMYPEYKPSFDIYENYITLSCNRILNAFTKRYIEDKYVIIPQKEYFVMDIYKDFVRRNGGLKNREDNILDIKNLLDNQSPPTINHIIKGIINEQMTEMAKCLSEGGGNDILPENVMEEFNKLEKKDAKSVFLFLTKRSDSEVFNMVSKMLLI